jgi:lipopolysaccharide biosynthesis glycosyltransferase
MINYSHISDLIGALMNESYGFVTMGDAKFFPGIYTLVKSVIINSPAQISVIDQGLTENQVEILKSLGADVVKTPRKIPINDKRFGCCYGFFDIEYIPYDTIIYLDADMIVLEDIRDLFSKITEKNILCSYAKPSKALFKKRLTSPIRKISHEVTDPEFIHTARKISSLYKFRKYKRLNSGIVGIKRSTITKMNTGIDSHSAILSQLSFPDQDLLSLLVADFKIKVKGLSYLDNATQLHAHLNYATENRTWPKKYNETISLSFNKGKMKIVKNLNPNGYDLENHPIRVLHYNTKDKPWIESVKLREGFKEIWDYYYDKDVTS